MTDSFINLLKFTGLALFTLGGIAFVHELIFLRGSVGQDRLWVELVVPALVTLLGWSLRGIALQALAKNGDQ